MDSNICPKCNGKGKVMTRSRQTGYEELEVPCTFCKGSGRK